MIKIEVTIEDGHCLLEQQPTSIDGSELEDACRMFFSAMVAIGFLPHSVSENMATFEGGCECEDCCKRADL